MNNCNKQSNFEEYELLNSIKSYYDKTRFPFNNIDQKIRSTGKIIKLLQIYSQNNKRGGKENKILVF